MYRRFLIYCLTEIRASQERTSLSTLVSQFWVRCSLIPICLGLSGSSLHATSFGFLWICTLWGNLSSRLFYEDWKDGTLEQSSCYFISLLYLALLKILSNAIITIFFSTAVFPLYLLFYGRPKGILVQPTFAYLHFVIGSLWIVQICAIQSSLTLQSGSSPQLPRIGVPWRREKLQNAKNELQNTTRNYNSTEAGNKPASDWRRFSDLKTLVNFSETLLLIISSLQLRKLRRSSKHYKNYKQSHKGASSAFQAGLTEFLSLPILIPAILIVSHPTESFSLLITYQSFLSLVFCLFVPKILETILKY